MSANSYLCRDCSKLVSATKNNRYRTHKDRYGNSCKASSVEIPPDLLEQAPADPKASADTPVRGHDFEVCPECRRNVKLTRLGYFQPHNSTLYGGDRCPTSGVRAFHSGKTKDVPLPGDTVPEKGVFGATVPKVTAQEEVEAATAEPALAKEAISVPPTGGPDLTVNRWGEPEYPEEDYPTLAELGDYLEKELGKVEGATSLQPAPPAGSTASTETNSPGSTTTSPLSGEWTEDWDSFFVLSAHLILMDAISAPTPAPTSADETRSLAADPVPGFEALLMEEWKGSPPTSKAAVLPMSDLAKTLAVQIKETFYAYSNRKTKDNRSAQTTLGPSEIGTPCDRRLAMALMGVPPVNPGGDGWAAFVGTCTHVGMAEVYTFANAGTGRYVVEMPVFLGMPSVPRGTTDLLDRRDGTVVDWKVMGFSSLKKFKEKGPSETYRTQAHVYGLGAERAGEKVRNVAIVGLPRGGFSLDEMHIWTEKYDRKFAQAALDRVEKISNEVAAARRVDLSVMQIAREIPTGDDCAYCPFHLKGDKKMEKGCPGK